MAYTETYNADDVDNVAIDGIVTFGVVFVQLATIIALVVLFVWMKKRFK